MPRIARLIVNTIASRFYHEMGGLEATEKEGDKGLREGVFHGHRRIIGKPNHGQGEVRRIS